MSFFLADCLCHLEILYHAGCKQKMRLSRRIIAVPASSDLGTCLCNFKSPRLCAVQAQLIDQVPALSTT